MRLHRLRRTRAANDRGVALVVVLLALSLVTALAVALILTTTAERSIAGHFGRGTETFYAADAAIERAMQDLLALADWNQALTGVVQSTFVDGPPGGVHTGPGGMPFDLTAATTTLRCNKAACDGTDLAAITPERPWRNNNPVWQPYAYGPLRALLPAGRLDSLTYVVVWVGDDPSENDDDPLRDGGVPVGCNPDTDPACASANLGRGRIVLRAEAFGSDGTHRIVEATVGRTDRARVLAWRELR